MCVNINCIILIPFNNQNHVVFNSKTAAEIWLLLHLLHNNSNLFSQFSLRQNKKFVILNPGRSGRELQVDSFEAILS